MTPTLLLASDDMSASWSYAKNMRTTITFDADVAAAIERLRHERGLGVSAAVNELIRTGLLHRPERAPFVQRTSSGQALVDVANIAEALELLEAPHPISRSSTPMCSSSLRMPAAPTTTRPGFP